MDILYAILYLQKKFDPENDPSERFHGWLFVIFSEFFSWIWYYPMMVTFLTWVTCNEDVFSGMGVECNYLDPNYIVGFVFAILGILQAVGSELLFSLFFQNNQQFKKDALNCENKTFLVRFNIFRLTVGIMICIRIQNYSYFIFYLFYHFLSASSLVVDFLYGNGLSVFATSSVRKVFVAFIVAYVGESCGLLIDELARMSGIQETEQAILYVAVFVIFWEVLFFVLQDYLIYQNVSSIDIAKHDRAQMLKKMLFFETILTTEFNNHDDTFIKGVLSLHLQTPCQNPILHGPMSCFCKQKMVYDAKKGKDATLAMFISNRSIFAKFLVKSWLETYLTLNPLDNLMRIIYAEFLFYKLRRINLALEQVHLVRKRSLNPLEDFRSFRLIILIREFNTAKNEDAYQRKLNFEMLNEVEEQIDQIKEHFSTIHGLNLQFWTLLKRANIDLDDLLQVHQQVTKIIQQCTNQFKNVISNLKQKRKWWFYYAWFQVFILNKKLKNAVLETLQGTMVSEVFLFAEDEVINLQQEEIKSQGSDEEVPIKSSNLVFDRLAGVIHVSDDNQGRIIRSNKNFNSIFGQDENRTLAKCMPPIYARNHARLIKNFHTSGKSKALYNQRRIFCLHSRGHVFAAQKFLKLFVNPFGQIEYVCMIRPILQGNQDSTDYILVNEDWEIDCLSQQLLMALGMNFQEAVLNRQDSLLCLLVLCPRLLQVSKLSKFLDEDDMSAFNLKNQDKKSDSISKIESRKSVPSLTKPITVNMSRRRSTVRLNGGFQNKLKGLTQGSQPSLQEPESLGGITSEIQPNFSMLIIQEVSAGKEQFGKTPQVSWILENIEEQSNNSPPQKSAQKFNYFSEKLQGQQLQLTIRVPKNLEKLCQEYYKEKQALKFLKNPIDTVETLQDRRYLYLEKNLQSNSLQFTRDKLSRAIKKQKKRDESGMMVIIRKLYDKYTRRSRWLSRVIKVECHLKFQRIGEVEQVGILKISRVNIVENTKGMDAKMTFFRSDTINQNAFLMPLPTTPTKDPARIGTGYQITSPTKKGLLQTEESQMQQQFISENQFRLDFNVQRNTKTFSLHPSENIFIKEPNNKPIKNLNKIYYMIWFIRIFFLLIVLINALTYFLGPFTYYPLLQNSGFRAQQITTLNKQMMISYNSLVDLDMMHKGYLDDVLFAKNDGVTHYSSKKQFEATIKEEFLSASTFLRDLLQDSSFVRSFNDADVFKDKAKDRNYMDQFAQFVLQTHQVSTISLSNPDTYKKMLTYYRKNLIAYLQPIVNQAFTLILSELEDDTKSLGSLIVIFVVAECVLSLLGGLAMVPLLNWVCDSFKIITFSFTEIKFATIKRVHFKMLALQRTYEYIVLKDHAVSSRLIGVQQEDTRIELEQQKRQDDSDDENTKINAQLKKREEPKGRYHRRMKLKLISVYLCTTVLTTVVSIVLHIMILNKSETIQHQSSLMSAIGELSYAWVVVVAKEAYLKDGIDYKLYNDTLQGFIAAQKLSNKTVMYIKITNILSLTNDDLISQCYFEDLCLEIPLTSIQKADCQDILIRALQHGISTYYHQLSSQISDLTGDSQLLNKVDAFHLYQQDKGNMYVLEAKDLLFNRWYSQLDSFIKESELFFIFYLCATMILIVFVYQLISEGLYIRTLQGEFEKHKMLYKRFMPDEVMNAEKKVRVKIVRAGLLLK